MKTLCLLDAWKIGDGERQMQMGPIANSLEERIAIWIKHNLQPSERPCKKSLRALADECEFTGAPVEIDTDAFAAECEKQSIRCDGGLAYCKEKLR
jgi:hypothetical protein